MWTHGWALFLQRKQVLVEVFDYLEKTILVVVQVKLIIPEKFHFDEYILVQVLMKEGMILRIIHLNILAQVWLEM